MVWAAAEAKGVLVCCKPPFWEDSGIHMPPYRASVASVHHTGPVLHLSTTQGQCCICPPHRASVASVHHTGPVLHLSITSLMLRLVQHEHVQGDGQVPHWHLFVLWVWVQNIFTCHFVTAVTCDFCNLCNL